MCNYNAVKVPCEHVVLDKIFVRIAFGQFIEKNY